MLPLECVKLRRSTKDAEEYLPYGSFLLFRCVIAAYLKRQPVTEHKQAEACAVTGSFGFKFFDADRGSGWKKLGSGINTPDQQHCVKTWQKLFKLKKTIMEVGRVLTCKRQARQRNMRKGFPWPNCVGGGRRLKHAKIRTNCIPGKAVL